MTPNENTDIGYWSSPLGTIQITVSGGLIRSVLFVDHEQRISSTEPLVQQVIEELAAYFDGTLARFDLPLGGIGTDFQQQVWQALLTIPYGETCSYADIANQIGKPKAVRAVGAANGKNPISIIVPCHRVIGMNGKLTGYAGGLTRKSRLLDLEKTQSQGQLW